MTKKDQDAQLREAYEKYIKANRVFILGAGFSAGAGIPMTAGLLDHAFQIAENECPGIASRIKRHIDIAFNLRGAEPELRSLSLSDICTFLHYVELRERESMDYWGPGGSRENLVLKFCLSKAIALNTPVGPDIPEIYLRFAKQLRHTDKIITFNWDCLLENALNHVGKEYCYHFSPEKVRIQKMHGSVHWSIGNPAKVVTWREKDWIPRLERKPLNLHQSDYGPIGQTIPNDPVEWDEENGLYVCEGLTHHGNWTHQKPLDEVQPMIVLPGYGKAVDVSKIAAIWAKPEWAFADTHDVFIVGLGLAHDDFIVRSFFLDNLPYISDTTGVEGRRVFLINPDPTAKENYAFLVGSSHVEFKCERFGSKHLDWLENEGRER